MQIFDLILTISAVLTAICVIGAFVWKIISWFLSQHKQTTDIEDLKTHHDNEIKTVKDELCVISFALLAALDGLKQLGANGNVTAAHNELEKHLNKQAHSQ